MNEKYMLRCLELAAKGLGKTKSNPLVGAVLVYKDRIIGEGYHGLFGGPHAEVMAVNSVKEHDLLKQSTLYVNLEPCCHVGKTPPCSLLIKKSGIPRVITGAADPNPVVSGKGVNFLMKSGIIVQTDVLSDECRFLNRRFYTFHQKNRPYIILKWAQSQDGFIDIRVNPQDEGERALISGKRSQILVHKWRSEEMGILVGTNTANMDNPSLTVKYWKGDNPLRLSIEKDKPLDENLKLLKDGIKTIVYTNLQRENTKETEYLYYGNDSLTIDNILTDLHGRDVISLIVEGGADLLNGFIQQNLWDEARILKGRMLLQKGLKAPSFNYSGIKQIINGDVLEVVYNKV